MLNAIKKHYPELEKKYVNYFKNEYQMPTYYKNAFYKKMEELCLEYEFKNNILNPLKV